MKLVIAPGLFLACVFSRLISVYTLCVGDIVLTENEVHLLFSPFAVFARFIIVVVLVDNHENELHSGVVSCAAPFVEVSVTALGFSVFPRSVALSKAVIVPEIVKDILVFALSISDLLNKVEFGVFLIYNSPHNSSTAPDIVPAVAPAGGSVVVEYAYSVVKA